jgi:predicted nuclease of predicted toxin-antitoxin system
VRFLVDENLPRRLTDLLRGNGHEAEHVGDLGLESASDPEILEKARDDERILISADTDFGTLLAESHAELPSIILIRRTSNRRAFHLASMVEANLPELTEDLESGCVVVFDAERVRVRRLPLI